MNSGYYSLTPSTVRDCTHHLLKNALAWRSFGRLVGVTQLLDLLCLAASLGSSLFDVVSRFCFGFSHVTARHAVYANLPDHPQLTNGLLDALYCFGSRVLRRRRWVVAIDTHLDPFYGDHNTNYVIGGKKKQGTKYFFGYATACLIHDRYRYTVALKVLTKGEKPHEIVKALLDQMSKRGLKLRGVVLDAGFNSGDVLLLLRDRNLSYVVPLSRCGNGKNRRNDCWLLPSGTVSTLQWKTEKSKKWVSTDVLVLGKANMTRVYAFRGWTSNIAMTAIRRHAMIRRWYRRRFGIETKYRQMRQGKARTTSKDVKYRLLLVGIGLLMRQVWVWLSWQIAKDRGLSSKQWVNELPLRRMWQWTADLIKTIYLENKEIRLSTPLLPLHGFPL